MPVVLMHTSLAGLLKQRLLHSRLVPVAAITLAACLVAPRADAGPSVQALGTIIAATQAAASTLAQPLDISPAPCIILCPAGLQFCR